MGFLKVLNSGPLTAAVLGNRDGSWQGRGRTVGRQWTFTVAITARARANTRRLWPRIIAAVGSDWSKCSHQVKFKTSLAPKNMCPMFFFFSSFLFRAHPWKPPCPSSQRRHQWEEKEEEFFLILWSHSQSGGHSNLFFLNKQLYQAISSTWRMFRGRFRRFFELNHRIPTSHVFSMTWWKCRTWYYNSEPDRLVKTSAVACQSRFRGHNASK